MPVAKVPDGYPTEMPDDFSLLHIAMYEAVCLDMQRLRISPPGRGTDPAPLFETVRFMCNHICNSVYVDVDRPAVDAGEED